VVTDQIWEQDKTQGGASTGVSVRGLRERREITWGMKAQRKQRGEYETMFWRVKHNRSPRKGLNIAWEGARGMISSSTRKEYQVETNFTSGRNSATTRDLYRVSKKNITLPKGVQHCR